MSPSYVLWLVETLAAASALVASLELLARRHLLADEGLLSWEVSQLRFRWLTHPGWGAILSYRATVVALSLRALASAALLTTVSPPALRPILLLVVAATTSGLALRCPYGLDGADQMTLTTFAACFLASLFPGETTALVCLWFLSLQVVAAYLISGIYKLWSPVWRDGSALPGLLRTRMYGNLSISRWLSRHGPVSRVLCISVVGWECLSPLVLVGPRSALIYLVLGVGFHASTALVMGLNTFFLSFVALYPALWFCASHPFPGGVVQ